MTEMQNPQVSENTPQSAAADYWGSDDTTNHYLPDGVQYFVIKRMNEGDKVKFQRMTNQDVHVQRDNTAKIKMDPSSERHTLIKNSVTGWHLFKGGQVVDFGPTILAKWLEVADPKVVEDLEHAIRMFNPWMQADMSLEDIEKEISRLEEIRRAKIESDAKDFTSADK